MPKRIPLYAEAIVGGLLSLLFWRIPMMNESDQTFSTFGASLGVSTGGTKVVLPLLLGSIKASRRVGNVGKEAYGASPS